MKTSTFRLDVRLSKEELEKMTKEVKETLAFEYQNKIFSSVDLWNIRRHRKSIQTRRSFA